MSSCCTACCAEHCEKKRFYETSAYTTAALIISFAALVLSYFWTEYIVAADSVWLYFNPGWLAVALSGIPLVAEAFESLFKHKKVKASLLITVAIAACVALEILTWTNAAPADGHTHSYLFAAGEVAFLMLIGEAIENATVRRSRRGIEKLINLAPATANILKEGKFVSMPVTFVEVGDTVLVKPYEQISVDGVVTKGRTAVNQSAITGESVPLDREAGDAVFAGTWNTSGAVEIKVAKKSDQTTVAKMVELVKEAEKKHAPIARTADKWAGYIVPMAVIFALLVFVIALLAFKLDWPLALVRGVTVLVVFCPCALGLATPTAIAAGIGNASYRGVLVKSGSALESLSRVDTFVFDKTGTLTTGEIRVADYFSDGGAEFLKYLGGAESNSEHPLAKAITSFAAQKATLPEASDTKSLVGTGVEAVVLGKKVLVAKIGFFRDVKDERIERWLQSGYTVVGMSVDGAFEGAIALGDTVREGAKQAVYSLHSQGVQTVMLTGDNEFSAKAVAEELGIGQVRHSLLPQDKLDSVEELKAQGRKVCMVGDGVNDAPSLAAADCSVTMGAMGSDVALEVSDIALMHDNIAKLGGIVSLSRHTLATIMRNIVIAMTVNILATVLSLLGWLNPALGALVHNGTSLLVVASSALLLLVKDKHAGVPQKPKIK